MSKAIGEWNQCRCGDGYQETEVTAVRGMCEPCIDYEEARERKWDNDCAVYGCPFCLNPDCSGDCGAR